jgi:glycosyltransferase involved in cell wall biosynthesis
VGTGVASLAALRRVLQGDVLHGHGLRAGLAVALARSGGTPLVLSWSEPVPTAGASGLVGRALTRTLLPAAAIVLAATSDLAEAATRLGAGQVRDLPPVRPESWVATRTPEQVREELALPDGPIVLAQARLRDQSRLDLLVDAASRWRAPGGAQVVLVGVGPSYRQLVARAMVARAPVTFAGDRTGPTPPAEGGEDRAGLADLLAAATVAVVTDTRARPAFALRAALAGLPLVVPHGAAAARLLGDECVVTVPLGDPDVLAAAVGALLDDPARRAALAVAARERVAAWPDAGAAASGLVEVYERVARTNGESADRDADTPDGFR